MAAMATSHSLNMEVEKVPFCSTRVGGFLRGACISAIVGMILILTYQKCIWCVVGIAIFSAVTMNCIPLMPLVFLLSLFVLAYHAIDYQKASIRVEVPLQDIVYIPTWDDVSKYVKVANPLTYSTFAPSTSTGK
jgi:hypothetical protein